MNKQLVDFHAAKRVLEHAKSEYQAAQQREYTAKDALATAKSRFAVACEALAEQTAREARETMPEEREREDVAKAAEALLAGEAPPVGSNWTVST